MTQKNQPKQKAREWLNRYEEEYKHLGDGMIDEVAGLVKELVEEDNSLETLYHKTLKNLYKLEDKTDYDNHSVSSAVNMIEDLKVNHFCPKCGREISTKEKDISNEEYFGACLYCQEDFYWIEVKTKLVEETEKKIYEDGYYTFIAEEGKEYTKVNVFKGNEMIDSSLYNKIDFYDETEVEEAKEEFERLRNDDPNFKEQWGKDDFLEWFEDVYLPTIT